MHSESWWENSFGKNNSFQSPGELKLTVSWYCWKKESIRLSDPLSIIYVISIITLKVMKHYRHFGCMRQVLRPGALGRPRGIGWRGRWEGGSGWGIHVYPRLIHVNVWQKPLQYKKNKNKKIKNHNFIFAYWFIIQKFSFVELK